MTRQDDAKLPKTYKQFVARFPALADCHERVAKAVDDIGPLDRKAQELVKIGICVGASLESALRSHVRRATQAGATRDEIEQAIMLAMNTCGFPSAVAAWHWAQIQFERDRQDGG